MLEAYVIAELAAILRDCYYESGRGLTAEQEREINKIAQLLLPKLDNYFGHRLRIPDLKKEIDGLKAQLEKLGSDKGSNDAEYMELRRQYGKLEDELEYAKKLLKIVVKGL